MGPPGALQPGAAEGERREGRLEQDPLRLPLVDEVALHDAVPAAYLLLVTGADPAGGVDVEVATHLAACQPRADQQLRGAEGAAGDDRRPPGAHGVGPPRAVAASGLAADADGAAILDQQAASLDSGAKPGAGGDRAGQVADVHPALRVDPAAVRAGAALDAVAGVAGDRPAGDAQRFRPLHRQLAVAAHPRRVEPGHAEELLGLDVIGIEVAGPADAVLVSPVVEHLVRSSEAGAGVDHRRPADDFRDRDGDRRVALGHRQPRVAVEGRDRVEVAARVVVSVEVLARLENDDVEARLGEGGGRGGPAGAGADDDDVAFLAVALRGGIAERAGRLRQGPVGEPAACLDPDPLLDLGEHRVAEGREDLGEQQQLMVEAEAGVLHAAEEVVAGPIVESAEPPGEGQPLEGAQPETDPSEHPRRERFEELGDRP